MHVGRRMRKIPQHKHNINRSNVQKMYVRIILLHEKHDTCICDEHGIQSDSTKARRHKHVIM